MVRPPERAVPARPVRTCRTGPPVHRRGTQPFPDRSARPNRRTTRENSLAEFIYTMYKARKAVGEKLILDDVTMSFYPGAKIGMVGPNGAGKSTILKIMAGLDQPSNGEARLSPGHSVGIRSEEHTSEHTSELQSRGHLVCRLL